nr:reverse transcriptase domain-containing protein [Tanacetum cinerariifolium]
MPKEIFAAESGKFKLPLPMVTPIEKRSSNKFFEFHNDKGHSTDECVQLRKQIEELTCRTPHIRRRRLLDGGDTKHYTGAWMNFIIVRSPSPYNGIIRRHGIREIQAVPSTTHGILKFSVNGGIVTIRSTILTPTECTTIAATPKDHAKKAEARHKNFKVAIHPDFPDQEITIGRTVSIKARTELCTLLKRNLDIFAWQPSNMTESVMLGEHNITYRPRTSVKDQILADFLVEKPNDAPPDTSVIETPQVPWTLFTDGSSCVDGSGTGLILTSPEGTDFTYALRFEFTASNNEAEYEALIAGIRTATQMGVCNVRVSVDSKLVANQVLGTYVAKEENMVKYLEKTKSLISGFANFSISKVPTSKNKKVNALSKIMSTSFAHLSKQVLVEVLKEKPIQEEEVAIVVEEEGPTWMTPIMEYLKDETLPGDRNKPWLRCVGPLQVDYVIREIHDESCSMYARPQSVVAKAIRLGYYWPTMHRDARDMIHTCNACQVHRPVPRNPQQPLTPITAPWPFKWGIDIASPFPEGPGKAKVVIPAEIGMPTYRTVVVDAVHNNEELRLNLDLLEERRECAAIREAKAKLKMTKYYNTSVRGVTFRPRDFIYRSNKASHAMDGGKLGPKWEGPYEAPKRSVTEHIG